MSTALELYHSMTSSFEANNRTRRRGLSNVLQRPHCFPLFVVFVVSLIVFADLSQTRQPQYGEHHERVGFFTEHGLTRLNISAEDYPSPGECRIWFVDVSANVQSPAGDCKDLQSRIPAGAWLIRRWKHDVNRGQITVYDTTRPGEVVVAAAVFDIVTGALLFETR